MLFELGRLPPEVRLLVWEATLPDRRVFHVSKLEEAPDDDKNTKKREQIFSFHIRHAPPIAHKVCRESRAVVLSRGYFLAQSSSETCTAARRPSAGLWFNPQRDMLYLDRNMRHCLQADMPGLDRVRHVGLEWRAWFRDVPRRRPDGEDVQHQQWLRAMGSLLRHCPNMESMGFVLPRVRHVGGVPSGREPYGAEAYECGLTPLPADTNVPWERLPVQIANGALVNYTGTALAQLGGESVPVAWKVLCRQMQTAAVCLLQDGGGKGAEDANGAVCESASKRQRVVSVRGWWLLRHGAPTDQEEQDVQEFWS